MFENPGGPLPPAADAHANPNLNPKAQLCFRTDQMTSFFDQVYRYRPDDIR